MANFRTTSVQYNPFTFSDWAVPLEKLSQLHANAQEKYLETDMTTGYLLSQMEEGTPEYEAFSQAKSAIDNAVDLLAKQGYNPAVREEMYKIKELYGSVIKPTEDAYTRMQQSALEAAKAKAHDPTSFSVFDTNENMLSQFIRNPTYIPQSYSGRTLINIGETIAQNLVRDVENDIALREVIPGYMLEMIKSTGLTPEVLQQLESNSPNHPLVKLLKQRIDDALNASGFDINNPTLRQRGEDFLKVGITGKALRTYQGQAIQLPQALVNASSATSTAGSGNGLSPDLDFPLNDETIAVPNADGKEAQENKIKAVKSYQVFSGDDIKNYQQNRNTLYADYSKGDYSMYILNDDSLDKYIPQGRKKPTQAEIKSLFNRTWVPQSGIPERINQGKVRLFDENGNILSLGKMEVLNKISNKGVTDIAALNKQKVNFLMAARAHALDLASKGKGDNDYDRIKEYNVRTYTNNSAKEVSMFTFPLVKGDEASSIYKLIDKGIDGDYIKLNPISVDSNNNIVPLYKGQTTRAIRKDEIFNEDDKGNRILTEGVNRLGFIIDKNKNRVVLSLRTPKGLYEIPSAYLPKQLGEALSDSGPNSYFGSRATVEKVMNNILDKFVDGKETTKLSFEDKAKLILEADDTIIAPELKNELRGYLSNSKYPLASLYSKLAAYIDGRKSTPAAINTTNVNN